MKNVRPYQLGKVIIKQYADYIDDACHACGNLNADVHLDGSVDGIIPDTQLAAYYGVKKVTNVHAVGMFNEIWIAYED